MLEERAISAISDVSHEWRMAGYWIQVEMTRYAVTLRPKLYIDGNQWCALYGENIQDGVAGFGNTPGEALSDFDAAFNKPLASAPDQQEAGA